MSKPLLIEGYENRQALNQPAENRTHPLEYAFKMCAWIVEDTARRVNDSRADFPFPFFRGDCHSHTVHSDGVGTVAQTAQMARAAGLDFQFVTDHWGVTQKPECLEHGLWWGQEPVTEFHHLGILGLDFAFAPQMDFYEDCRRAQELGAQIFIPHPCGWWPDTIYSDEQKQKLFDLPDPFLMEICNGANNVVSAFDATDDAAQQLWDELLLAGKTVHAIGNTDAHAPHCIGMVWNGVLATGNTQSQVIEALRAGNNFVSDGPLLAIQCGEVLMGGKATTRDDLKIYAADTRGLLLVRVLADGKEILRREVFRQTKIEMQIEIPSHARRFVRAEIISRDGRRAFSNPIYLA